METLGGKLARMLISRSVDPNPGLTYRLRLVNGAGEWGYRFSIAGKNFTVISISGNDIKPITNVAFIELQPGERYDVLVNFTGPTTTANLDLINVTR